MIEILLPVFYAFCLLIIINKSNFFYLEGIDKRMVYLVFILKNFSGVAIAFIYSSNYSNRMTSDIFYFFDDSKYLFELLVKSPVDFFKIVFNLSDQNVSKEFLSQLNYWNRSADYGVPNDNRTIILFNVFCRFFSFGVFHVHTVFICFLSLIGQVALYITFYNIMKEKKWILFFCCFLIPSVMVWSSAVLKDGLLFFAFGLYVYYLFQLIVEKFTIKNLIVGIILFFFCAFIKGYTLFATIPATLCFVYFKFFSFKRFYLKVLLIHLASLVFIFNLKFILKDYDVLYMLFIKQKDMINTGIQANAGSLVYIPRISSFINLILNSPYALFNSIFRPHVFEIKNPLYLVPAFENCLLLFGIIVSIFNFKKPEKNYYPLILFAFSFSIFMMLLIGHTVPILGSSTRYRSIVLPFIFLLIFLFIDFEKLVNKHRFLTKFNFLFK